jgi:predicted DCC family thiol-disulfide oxidoreductase YuxK
MQYIILFDGVCNLCQKSVQFVISKDTANQFKFASLQSPIGQQLLAQHQLSTTDMSSFVLLKNTQIYVKSDAGLQVLKTLGYPWRLLYVFILLPKGIRDAVYRFVARNRYRFWKTSSHCWLPTKELKAKFL